MSGDGETAVRARELNLVGEVAGHVRVGDAFHRLCAEDRRHLQVGQRRRAEDVLSEARKRLLSTFQGLVGD